MELLCSDTCSAVTFSYSSLHNGAHRLVRMWFGKSSKKWWRDEDFDMNLLSQKDKDFMNEQTSKYV